MASYEDDRTRQIRLGQAMNLAVTLAAYEKIGESAELALERAHELVPQTLAFITAIQDGAVNTVEEIKAAFPGATVENVIPGPGNPVFVRREPAGPVTQAAPIAGYTETIVTAPQPAPVPGATVPKGRDDDLWNEFFADRSAWWDNTTTKKNPAGADFSHKQKKNKNGYPVGLWLNGKYGPAPQWVFDRLAEGRA